MLSAEALRGELLELWTGGHIPTRAILMVTHNIEEAAFMADRIVVMDKEPGRVVADLSVDLPYPRQVKATPFLNVVDRVYATLAGQTQPEHVELGTAPRQPGRTRGLPPITIGDLAGLLERLAGVPNNRADIYQLAGDTDSDHLLRLTETAELLGFAHIAQSDITLIPLGETFAASAVCPCLNGCCLCSKPPTNVNWKGMWFTPRWNWNFSRTRPTVSLKSSSTGAATPSCWPMMMR